MQPILTHLALQVVSVDACFEFYTQVCGMRCVHERKNTSGGRVVWLASPGMDDDFIMVLLGGGQPVDQAESDYSHLGFAMDTKDEVDQIAERARERGDLVWEPRQDSYPAGYYCGLRDPDGRMVEFSYGQPLGPGAEEHRLA